MCFYVRNHAVRVYTEARHLCEEIWETSIFRLRIFHFPWKIDKGFNQILFSLKQLKETIKVEVEDLFHQSVFNLRVIFLIGSIISYFFTFSFFKIPKNIYFI